MRRAARLVEAVWRLVGGLGAIASGVGRVIWGRLIDKLGFQVAWTTTTVIQFTTMLLMPLATTSKAAFELIRSAVSPSHTGSG